MGHPQELIVAFRLLMLYGKASHGSHGAENRQSIPAGATVLEIPPVRHLMRGFVLCRIWNRAA